MARLGQLVLDPHESRVRAAVVAKWFGLHAWAGRSPIRHRTHSGRAKSMTRRESIALRACAPANTDSFLHPFGPPVLTQTRSLQAAIL